MTKNDIARRLGWPIVILLSLLPLWPWLALRPASARFASIWGGITALGQAAGLVGLAAFGLNIILAARLKWLEPYFGGLDRLYRKHHWLGGASLALLVAHPLLLSVRYFRLSFASGAGFFLEPGSLPVVYGKLALLLLVVLLLLTYWRKLPYQIWKSSHKFLGLAFFLAVLHLWFIPSDTSRSPWLRGYLLGLALAALAAVFYRSVAGRFLVPKKRYLVERVTPRGGEVTEVALKAVGAPLEFSPGQFLFVSFKQDGLPEESHPFTISSSNDKLELSIKSLGDYTRSLPALRPGTPALVEGPFGRFSYLEAEHERQVWVAGGIGITPFLSMAKSLSAKGGDYDIDLLYCTKAPAEAVFLPELEQLAADWPGLRVRTYFSDEQGRLTADKLIALVGELAERDFFLCGPPPMMRSLRQQLRDSGVDNKLIHSEEFSIS